MRYEHIIQEEPVISSWISDLTYDDGDVIMALNSGREYQIQDVPLDVYESWMEYGSKGQFWHGYIRGMYQVWRIA